MKPLPCSGIILTGAADGQPPGQTGRLTRLIAMLRPLVHDLVLVTENPQTQLDHDVLIVAPLYRPGHLLAALHAGLFHAAQPHALAVSADHGLMRAAVLQSLLDAAAPEWDLVAPVVGQQVLPVPAIYARGLAQRMETQLTRGSTDIGPLLKRTRFKAVSEKVLRQRDPELISFLDIRAATDRAKIEAHLRQHLPQPE